MPLFSLQSNGTERLIVLNHDMKLSVLWKILHGTGKYLMVFTTKVKVNTSCDSCEYQSLETGSSKERNIYI